MYNFKVFQEAGWAAFVAALVFVAEQVALQPDWTNAESWIPTVVAGAVRAAIGAGLAILSLPDEG